MKNVVHPWTLQLSHPHASVQIQQKPLAKPGLLGAGQSNPHVINSNFVTDDPILNDLIQLAIAVIPVALPFIAGMLGRTDPQASGQ